MCLLLVLLSSSLNASYIGSYNLVLLLFLCFIQWLNWGMVFWGFWGKFFLPSSGCRHSRLRSARRNVLSCTQFLIFFFYLFFKGLLDWMTRRFTFFDLLDIHCWTTIFHLLPKSASSLRSPRWAKETFCWNRFPPWCLRLLFLLI